MKEIVKWLNNPFVLVALVVLGSIFDLVLLGQHYDLSKSDWGTWVGSIGTVGTLIGTIHLARTETRGRERQELLNARIYGTYVRPRVDLAWSTVGSIRGRLNPINADKEPEYFCEIAQQIEAINLCTADELVVLAVHPTGVARKLAIAAERIKNTAALVNTLPRMANPAMHENLPTNLRFLCNQLTEIEAILHDAMGDCMIAAVELERAID